LNKDKSVKPCLISDLLLSNIELIILIWSSKKTFDLNSKMTRWEAKEKVGQGPSCGRITNESTWNGGALGYDEAPMREARRARPPEGEVPSKHEAPK